MAKSKHSEQGFQTDFKKLSSEMHSRFLTDLINSFDNRIYEIPPPEELANAIRKESEKLIQARYVFKSYRYGNLDGVPMKERKTKVDSLILQLGEWVVTHPEIGPGKLFNYGLFPKPHSYLNSYVPRRRRRR